MADQCIVCLETLAGVLAGAPPDAPSTVAVAGNAPDAALEPPPAVGKSTATSSPGKTPDADNSVQIKQEPQEDENVAQIQVCGHLLHDSCLKEWTEKANSCPICRQIFHLVHVYDKVGGTIISSYRVQDKKQVAEFDAQVWLEENPDEVEEDNTPCPVCNLSDREDILMLCDGCDTPYHTECIGLGQDVPDGAWYCMECVDHLGLDNQVTPNDESQQSTRGRNGRFARAQPRTQARIRRARQRARSDVWQGAWGQITGRVWDTLSIDLDYQNDDDPLVWEGYRRSQQLREQERQELQRWQQRLNIASRLGAREVFQNHLPTVLAASAAPATPQPPRETREERMAWGDFEKALDSETPNSRKRKSRSGSAEADEPQQEPERKLKRPRTRRLPAQNGESSSSSRPLPGPSAQPTPGSSRPPAASPTETAPSFLSSLLKEVEMSTPSDDENIRNLFGPIPGANDAASPAASSPTASGYNSPRAASTTPPPNRSGRPSSPPLSLSSHIEPIYPKANYSPTRSPPPQRHSPGPSSDNSDSERRSRRHGAFELRQPRPRRPQPVVLSRSPETSPVRPSLPLEMKENISGIVRNALKPHWKSSRLTTAQYENINRIVSRKLYEEVADPASVDDEARRGWEKLAAQEVARLISDLTA